ncbi:unnamed protein product, partial [Closterium sp. NIES-54]
FDTWLDDLQLYLLSDSKDSVSLFDLALGAATAPPATADSATHSQWLTRDAAARLAIRNHLPLAECAHFGQHRIAQALYDAVVARYSSPATAALGHLLLPYLFPELSAFAMVEDLVSHLRTSDARYHATDHFLSLDPTSLTVDLLEEHLLAVETSAVAVGAARGTPRKLFFEGCSPSPLAPSYASAAADVPGAEDVGAASASAKCRNGKGKGSRGGGSGSGGGGGGSSGGGSGGGSSGGNGGGSGGSGGVGGGSGGSGGCGSGGIGGGRNGAQRGGSRGGQRQQQQRPSEAHSPQQLREWLFQRGASGGSGSCPPPPAVGPAPLGVSQVNPLRGTVPVEVAGDSGAARGTASGGEEPGGAKSEGTGSWGAEPGGAEPRGTELAGVEPGGVEPGGAEPRVSASSGGPAGASPRMSPRPEPLSLQQLREWLVRRARHRSGATGARATGGTGAGGCGTRGTAPAGPRGARTRGTGAAGTGGVGGAGAGDPTEPGVTGAGGTGACGAGAGGVGAGGTGAGGAGAGGAGAGGTGGAGAGDTVRPRPHFFPLLQQFLGIPSSTGLTPPLLCPPPDQSQPPLQPASPLPAPSPYTQQSGGLTERCEPASRPARRAPRPCPPSVPGTHTMALRPSSVPTRVPLPPTVSCLLATVVTDPSFESAAASALIAELLDFAAACRLDYATALAAMDAEMASWKSTGTYVDAVPPSRANIVDGMWIFRVKRPPGSPPAFKARYVARGFMRTTLAAFGFAPSTSDPSLFLRTDTSLPSFYVLVYVNGLVFATANTETLTLVKSELQKRHTCTDLGELRSYLSLQITRDRARRTITPTQSHMVHQVLQRFDFQVSLPQSTPLSTGHSLSAPPSDESVEPSGPYPELVGCLMYLMTCTQPDLAYPLCLLARYVAPGRHQKVHWDAAKRVLRYLWSTSGMGLVLRGRGPVVLIGHADTSWVDDSATQRSSQGYTFTLGSGSISWRSTYSFSVLSFSCEAEIYAGAMAAQELCWLTYLLTDLGEQPCSPPVLYVDNKVMIALYQEHSLEPRTKHIALRYFQV